MINSSLLSSAITVSKNSSINYANQMENKKIANIMDNRNSKNKKLSSPKLTSPNDHSLPSNFLPKYLRLNVSPNIFYSSNGRGVKMAESSASTRPC